MSNINPTTPPVLITAFNRPQKTAAILEAVGKAKPAKLYVAADGHRDEKAGEKERCDDVRAILRNPGWDCEIKTLFQTSNLGCGRAMTAAISWFFENEDAGIILEDDCLPSPSFFSFCDEMLRRYKDNTNVMSVAGTRLPLLPPTEKTSYSFSKYTFCWGWATWRRAWAHYDFEMTDLERFADENQFRNFSDGHDAFAEYWLRTLESQKSGHVDTWDYQWVLTCWINRGLTCIPAANLISNIGFDFEGTHTLSEQDAYAKLDLQSLEFPLCHPRFCLPDMDLDSAIREFVYGLPNQKPQLETRLKQDSVLTRLLSPFVKRRSAGTGDRM